VATSSVADKLWEQLLARERDLDSREGTIAAWEDGLLASEFSIGRVYVEHNAESAQAEATWQDNIARIRAFTSSSKHSINFNQMLEDRGTPDPPFSIGYGPGGA
jgi:hypothetical protein